MFHSWLYGPALEAGVREFESLHPDNADVMKLVDVPDLESGVARRGGSSPFIRTNASLVQWIE